MGDNLKEKQHFLVKMNMLRALSSTLVQNLSYVFN